MAEPKHDESERLPTVEELMEEAKIAPHRWPAFADQPEHIKHWSCWCDPELVLLHGSMVWDHRILH